MDHLGLFPSQSMTYQVSRSQYKHGVKCTWVCQVNHGEAKNGQQLQYIYWSFGIKDGARADYYNTETNEITNSTFVTYVWSWLWGENDSNSLRNSVKLLDSLQ